MNITPMEMYWITRLDGIVALFVIAGIILTISCAVGFFACLDCGEPGGVRWCKRGLVVGILSIIAAVFIPTKKEIAAIIVVPMVVNNEKVQEIASGSLEGVSNLVKLSNKWLEENLKEKAK